jgi:hypothetical protein
MVQYFGNPRSRSRRALLAREPYILSLRSDKFVYQNAGKTTVAQVGDPVRCIENRGSLVQNVLAPSDAARPTRTANGFAFSGAQYFSLGTSAMLTPATLHVSFTFTRTGDLSGIYPCVCWCKGNGNYGGDGWFLEFRGPDARMEFWGDGFSGGTTVSMALNTIFPLNTPTTFDLTFDPGRSPKTIVVIGGITQTIATASTSTITANTELKYFGFNSPGYSSGYLNNCTIENLIIDSVVP